MKVRNIPRYVAQKFTDWNNSIWISIFEPYNDTAVQNELAKELGIPKLEIPFSDLTTTLEFQGEILHPPSEKDSDIIVKFILNNPGKDIIVNCLAGVSRSGAVAQFCHDFLGYDWPRENRSAACPNSVLYRNLVKSYACETGNIDTMTFEDYSLIFPKYENDGIEKPE